MATPPSSPTTRPSSLRTSIRAVLPVRMTCTVMEAVAAVRNIRGEMRITPAASLPVTIRPAPGDDALFTATAGLVGDSAGSNRQARTILRAMQLLSALIYLVLVALVFSGLFQPGAFSGARLWALILLIALLVVGKKGGQRFGLLGGIAVRCVGRFGFLRAQRFGEPAATLE